MKNFPKSLPRRAYAFRLLLDSEHGERIISGEWRSASLFHLRLVDETVPMLQSKGLQVDCIASGEMPGDADKGYGSYWHWTGERWNQVAGSPEPE